MTTTAAPTTLGPDALEAVSRRQHEPDWLRQRRSAALDHFLATPMPSRTDEAWRRTDLSRLSLDGLPLVLEPGPGSLGDLAPDLLELVNASGQESGLLVQSDGAVVMDRLDEALAARGVIFAPLAQAARHHAGKVQAALGTVVHAGEGKFEALADAVWTGGIFVYVPAGVSVEVPLHALVHATVPGLAATRTLVVAEASSQVTLVEEQLSPRLGQPSLNTGIVEILAGDNAQVTYVSIQQWGRHTWNLVTQRARTGRDASISMVNAALGGRVHRAVIDASLQGQGSSARLFGMVFGDESQHFEHLTLQDHRAPHTTSDAVFKTALDGKARAAVSGLIRILPEARQTEAFLECRNMLLSSKARADAIPSLEILANEVRCKHAATVGRVDEEQVFYLMSRGVDRATAEALIVSGFFASIVDRIPLEWVRAKLGATLARRLAASHLVD